MSSQLTKATSSEFYKQGWKFIGITYLISWLLWSPAVLSAYGIINVSLEDVLPLVLLGTFVPSAIGLVLTKWWPSDQSTTELAKRGVQLNFPKRWYLILVGLLPTCALLAHAINSIQSEALIPGLDQLRAPWMILLVLLGTILLAGPLGEEFGWRGYLQDRFADQFGRVTGSFVVGIIWTIWHIPFFLVEGSPQYTLPFWLFAITLVSLSVIIGELQHLTNGSLLPALIMHGWINTTMSVFPLLDVETGENWIPWLYVCMMLSVICIGIATKRVWKKSTMQQPIVNSS